MYGALHEMVKVGVVSSVVVILPGSVGTDVVPMSVKIWMRLLDVSAT